MNQMNTFFIPFITDGEEQENYYTKIKSELIDATKGFYKMSEKRIFSIPMRKGDGKIFFETVGEPSAFDSDRIVIAIFECCSKIKYHIYTCDTITRANLTFKIYENIAGKPFYFEGCN